MGNKSKDYGYYFILGQSFHRTELIKLGIVLLLGLLVLGVVAAVFFRSLMSNPNRVLEAEPGVVVGVSGVEMSPLESLFTDYFEQTRMDAVHSIRAVGKYKVNDVEMELTFLAKYPQLYKQSLVFKDRGIEVEIGFDGETAWMNQSHAVIDASNEDLMALNKTLAILESTIPCLAWDYESEVAPNFYELMPETVWNGYDCIVIKNTKLIPDIPVYHYIDPETGFERYRRATIKLDKRRHRNVELFYDEPLPDSSYAIPSGIELLLDGVVFYKVNFEKIDVNVGIPDFMFEARVKSVSSL